MISPYQYLLEALQGKQIWKVWTMFLAKNADSPETIKVALINIFMSTMGHIIMCYIKGVAGSNKLTQNVYSTL